MSLRSRPSLGGFDARSPLVWMGTLWEFHRGHDGRFFVVGFTDTTRAAPLRESGPPVVMQIITSHGAGAGEFDHLVKLPLSSVLITSKLTLDNRGAIDMADFRDPSLRDSGLGPLLEMFVTPSAGRA